MKSVKAIVTVTLAAAAFAACNENPVEQNSDAQLTVSPDSVVVGINQSSPLSVSVRDASGAIQYGVSLQYVSRDQKVAAVKANGTIVGVAVGSTYVVATLADRPAVRDSARVRVQTSRTSSCATERPDLGGVASAADRALFAYDVNAPLNLSKKLEATTNGVERSAVFFDSPAGGRVSGLLFDPVGRSGLRPGIVLMHGMPANARAMSNYAQGLAQHGAVVIAIDAPFARRSGLPLRITPEDRAEQIQLIKDLQRAVDVLRERPNVDAARIAYVGHSYGGTVGALFVGIERRIRAAVLDVAGSGLVLNITPDVEDLVMGGVSCATRAAWFQAMTPIEPVRFIPHASPTPLLLQNGRSDKVRPEALHAAAPEPKTILWYDAGHSLNQQAVVDRHVWLNEQIGLDRLK